MLSFLNPFFLNIHQYGGPQWSIRYATLGFHQIWFPAHYESFPMQPPFSEFSWGSLHIPHHICPGDTHHGSLPLWRWQHVVVGPVSLGCPTQFNHTYIPRACNWMVHPKYRFLAALKSSDLLPSTSHTYMVPMNPHGRLDILFCHISSHFWYCTKKGGNLIQPIWSYVGNTNLIGMPGFCGKK